MVQRGRGIISAAAILAAACALTACSSSSLPREDTQRQTGDSRTGIDDSEGVSLGGLFGGGDRNEQAQPGIGVNSFLWRASLDTLNFMPLASADPFGGVIITDWQSDVSTPNERLKATVYILDTRLRADALNVSIFRQTRANASAPWQDASVDPATAIQIENAILTRARQIRLSTLDNQR